jgi:DUF1009 family protein
MPPKLGIVAGGGALPAILVQHCRRSGREFAVAAIADHCDPKAVEGAAQRRFRLGRLGGMIRYFREAGVGEVVIAGGVSRPSLLEMRPDFRALRFYLGARGWRLGDGRLLNALIGLLEQQEGFAVVGAEAVMPDLLARAGPLGKAVPGAAALQDIALGRREALALGASDRGQGVVVRDGAVIGREDREGTDALLRRCAQAGGRGGVLVKIAKPLQDRRVDLPAIGPGTVKAAAEAGLKGIAVESGGALILDRAAVAEAADRVGLFVVALAPERPA